MNKIKIDFLWRDFISSDKTGTTVRGYEPAKMVDENGNVAFGRVVDLDKLKQLEFIETLYFSFQTSLTHAEIDLEPILQGDNEGRKWFMEFKRRFGEEVPLEFFMQPLEFPSGGKYSLMPIDYFERIKANRGYRCPEGVLPQICSQGDSAYWKIVPPMRFKSGEWISGARYCRTVNDAKGIFDSYALNDPKEAEYYYSDGILLGRLNEADICQKSGDFEGCFPIEHLLETKYLVALRDASNSHPLTIRVSLAK